MIDTPAEAPPDRITSRDAITSLIGANGDAKLAAVRLAVSIGAPVTENLVLTAIAADPNAPNILYRQMQVLMVLQAFGAFRKTQMTFLEKLGSMSPDTVSRTYVAMLRNMTEATRSASAAPLNLDPVRGVLDALPPEIADVVERMLTVQPSLASQEATLAALAADADTESNDEAA